MQNWYNNECKQRDICIDENPSFNIDQWESSYGNEITNPQQSDAVSCGAFTCMYIAYQMKFGRLPTKADFTEIDIPQIRRYIIYSILFANQSVELHGPSEYDCMRTAETDNEGIADFGTETRL